MHFYVNGDRYQGYRPGHRQIRESIYVERFGHPLDHPANRTAR